MVTRAPDFLVSAADAVAVLGALPQSARELAGHIGLPLALELLRQLGGSVVFVRQKLPDDSPLIPVIGREAAAKLTKYYGGSYLELATLAGVQRMLRDNAIRADFDAGGTPNQLAQRYGLSCRIVRSILTASPATTPRRLAGIERHE